jgi:hypothetical protein
MAESPYPDRCKSCALYTILYCACCGLPICTRHSSIVGTAQERWCRSCLQAERKPVLVRIQEVSR